MSGYKYKWGIQWHDCWYHQTKVKVIPMSGYKYRWGIQWHDCWYHQTKVKVIPMSCYTTQTTDELMEIVNNLPF
jgi:hypothetical protein